MGWFNKGQSAVLGIDISSAAVKLLELSKNSLEKFHNKKILSYNNEKGWNNRIIFGESLEVMNSLLLHENMNSKVQMIYFDPPFGINFDTRYNAFESSSNSSRIPVYWDKWTNGNESYLKYLEEL